MKSRPRLQRPRSVYIEYLEKRIAPATFVVTNLNDAGAGSLRQAVLDANTSPGSDTIVFKGDATDGEIRLTTGEINITGSVNVKGPGADKLTINAQDLSRIFHIDDGTAAVKNVTISSLSMVDGNSGIDSGGAIRSLESLTLANSVITGSRASAANSYGYGGALYAKTDGKVVIRNCKIVGNTARGGGAGLSISTKGDIQITNTVISGNTAGRFAGGVYADIFEGGTGNILISRSIITDNIAAFGGGVFADNNRTVGGNNVGKITVQDTHISGNSATTVFGTFLREGGGLEVNSGVVLVERCTLTNNVAVDHGGGLHSNGTTSLTIKSSQLTNNHTISATGGGSGIYINGGGTNTLVQNTLISSNTSAGDGGGMLVRNDRLTIQKSTISGNTAGAEGGGIYARQGTLNVDRAVIRDNQSGTDGGGIFTTGAGTEKTDVRITRSLFTVNRAVNGGGLNTGGDGSITIADSRFIQNTTSIGDGGGAYLRTDLGVISITGSLFTHNTGGNDGGSLVLNGGATPITITNTVITSNFTGSGVGGGIAVFDGALNLNNSAVSANVSSTIAGGIWVDRTATLHLNASKVTGNVAPSGPQIYKVPSS
ncbi:beta strand repeat-containing protein [Verrucomicrobiota bacterium sgz303538]